MLPHRPHRVDPRILEFAREMRHKSAPAEAVLWSCLRGHRLGGYKFRRQHPVGEYVLDFFCAKCQLAVELDGDSHSERAERDDVRTGELEAKGLSVIRFENPEVFDSLEGVLLKILDECERRTAENAVGPSPTLSPWYRGEG